IVFVCSHYNDMEEATYWYPQDEVEKFVRSSPGDHYEPVARRSCWPQPWWHVDRRVWDAHLAPALRTAGAIAGWRAALANDSLPWRPEAPAAADGIFVPAKEVISLSVKPDDERNSPAARLGWQAHRQALAQIHDICRREGAHLVLFDL